MAAPLINRSAIQAACNVVNALQLAAIYRYRQTVLKACVEVVNQLALIRNLGQGYEYKSRRAQAMSGSISLAGELFNSARADYAEVLFTQRDELESRVELIEMKQQLIAHVKACKAHGGGSSGPADSP